MHNFYVFTHTYLPVLSTQKIHAFLMRPQSSTRSFRHLSSPARNGNSVVIFAKKKCWLNSFLSQRFETSIFTVVFFWDPDLSSKTNKHKQKLVAIEDENHEASQLLAIQGRNHLELMGAGNGRYVHDRPGVYGSQVVTHFSSAGEIQLWILLWLIQTCNIMLVV